MRRLNLPGNKSSALIILVLLGMLAACVPDGTSPATEAGVPDTAAAIDGLVLASGRNADGTFYLGDVDAPVTLVNYSDFL